MKVLVFSDTDCIACKPMKVAIETLSRRNGFDFKEYFIENDLETFRQYEIMGTPTCLVVDDDGKEVGRFIGHQTEVSAESSLRKYGVIE